jgi:AcrR family transcriptional regulator
VAPEESEPPSRSDRSRISRSDTARDRRGRILIAAAESAVQHGYAATTVTEIAARARLDKRVFYDHFSDKRQAFLAVHELAFKQTMSIAAAAYLSAKRLPERVWRSLRAASDYHAANPAFAYVGYVESHALGSPAIQRADESRQAFAIFLHAASERIGEPHDLTAAEATGAAIFEIAHRQIRHDKASQLPRYAYHASFICLAPLLGVAAADRFVQAKINDANNESPPGPK